jgi:hypothetical protein
LYMFIRICYQIDRGNTNTNPRWIEPLISIQFF